MKLELFRMLSHIPYTIPVDPGTIPQYAPSSSGLAQQQVTYEFDKAKQIFKNHYNMNLVLKVLIIEAVNKVYLEEKCDRYTGFLSVTSKDLINHLL